MIFVLCFHFQKSDLNGNRYTAVEVAQACFEIVQNFKSENPKFLDCRFIYAPNRTVSLEELENHIEVCEALRQRIPNFIVGFDLVGNEDSGNLLSFYSQRLSQLKIPFYFHAGESFKDLAASNLTDAILLNTKRIGHGFALPKYPCLVDLVKEKGIGIEVCPISNQQLGLCQDLRLHPASILMKSKVEVTISSDDPAFWGASPLTHDMLATFLWIMGENEGLATVKALIQNSIRKSSFNDTEKEAAMKAWSAEWLRFVAEETNLYANPEEGAANF